MNIPLFTHSSTLSFLALLLFVPSICTSQPQTSLRRSPRLSDEGGKLELGTPILGFYEDVQGPYVDWMSTVPDSTPLLQMNLPGAHDAATWNYTQETQDRFIQYTGPISEAKTFQCQDQSLFQMLGAGMRVFDLRVGFLPDNHTVGFYHGPALLSPTATLEDVFYGFYKFLDDHPKESLLISIKSDNTTFGTSDSSLEQAIVTLLKNDVGKQFWAQDDSLGTIGEKRGKITLLRRLDWSSLPPSDQIGLPLLPSEWNDNDPSFSIIYNKSTNATAYIEDEYEPGGPSSVDSKITWKLNATTSHLDRAVGDDFANQLFITFASAERNDNSPPIDPKLMALGRKGVTLGVNERLLPYLQRSNGKRLGVVFLDWYSGVPELMKALLDS